MVERPEVDAKTVDHSGVMGWKLWRKQFFAANDVRLNHKTTRGVSGSLLLTHLVPIRSWDPVWED